MQFFTYKQTTLIERYLIEAIASHVSVRNSMCQYDVTLDRRQEGTKYNLVVVV